MQWPRPTGPQETKWWPGRCEKTRDTFRANVFSCISNASCLHSNESYLPVYSRVFCVSPDAFQRLPIVFMHRCTRPLAASGKEEGGQEKKDSGSSGQKHARAEAILPAAQDALDVDSAVGCLGGRRSGWSRPRPSRCRCIPGRGCTLHWPPADPMDGSAGGMPQAFRATRRWQVQASPR